MEPVEDKPNQADEESSQASDDKDFEGGEYEQLQDFFTGMAMGSLIPVTLGFGAA